MTCAKKKVVCLIVNGVDSFVGTNDCENPQETCPRAPGEDYTKCKTICKQKGHAEEIALNLAGEKAKGSVVYLKGINWYCRTCQEKLFKAGVQSLKLFESLNILV